MVLHTLFVKCTLGKIFNSSYQPNEPLDQPLLIGELSLTKGSEKFQRSLLHACLNEKKAPMNNVLRPIL